jgi:ABC-type Fe3+ transport system substrate-binding protein
MLDLDGRVLVRDTRFPGITYNSKLISNSQVPRRLEDLLDSKWKGKIASTPYAGNFDRLADGRVLGYERTKAFLRRFSKGIAGLIRCGEDERIATGEFWVLALNCGNHEQALGKKNGLPVEGTVIEDIPLMLTHAYIVVPKNSAHPNLATLFAAFVVSAEGQQIIWENQRVASHLVGGTIIERQYKAVKDKSAKIVDFSASYTAGREKSLNEIRAEFQKIITQK